MVNVEECIRGNPAITMADAEVHHVLPNERGMVRCAEAQIRYLLSKQHTLTRVEEDCIDDGFFLCDLSVVERKLQVWKEKLFPRVNPYYALKCNPDPMVASMLPAFDCASLAELKLASSNTASSDNIVYANPQRAERDLDQALRMFPTHPPAYTFDGPEELYKLRRALQRRITDPGDDAIAEAPPTSTPPLILRLLVPDHDSQVPLGEKFGVPLERVPQLLVTAKDLGMPVVGVSFHCGSGNHDPTAYITALKIAKQALDLIQSMFDRPPSGQWIVDMGGGYPGTDGAGGDSGRFGELQCNEAHDPSVDEESTLKIATAVCPVLDELFPPSENDVLLIAEPGRYFVEAAFVLCSRIYRKHEECDGTKHYYIAQGVQGVFKDCVLCDETFVPTPFFTEKDSDESTSLFPSTVHGPSGESFDIVCKDHPLPNLNIGDWLLFDRMGAYTLSIAAVSGQQPIRYVKS